MKGGSIKNTSWNKAILDFKKQSLLNKYDNKNVIIIGTGPVGLYTAILYKKEKYNVLVIEQFNDFDREWIFFIQNSPAYNNIQNIPLDIRKMLDESGCFVGPAPSVKLGRCYNKLNPSLEKMRMNDKEKDFLCDINYGYNEYNEDNDKLEAKWPVPVSVSIQHKNLVNNLLDIFLRDDDDWSKMRKMLIL